MSLPDGLTRFYVRNGKLIMPTVARTGEGFYIDIEPVSIVDMSDDSAVRGLLEASLTTENPSIPTPERASEPGSVILDAIGLRRWEAFEKDAVMCTLHKSHEAVDLYATGRGANGMWTEAAGLNTSFASETKVDTIVQAVLEALLERPELARKAPSLPMLLPKQEADETDQNTSSDAPGA